MYMVSVGVLFMMRAVKGGMQEDKDKNKDEIVDRTRYSATKDQRSRVEGATELRQEVTTKSGSQE
jgi:hypothetical protein